MNPLSTREQEIARRLLNREATVQSSGNQLELAKGVLTVINRQFEEWFGVEGTRSMLNRALDRVRAAEPGLDGVRITSTPEGTELHVPRSAGVEETLDREEVAAVIASIFALTTRLIGQPLLDRMLNQAFPDLELPSSGTDKPHEASSNGPSPNRNGLQNTHTRAKGEEA